MSISFKRVYVAAALGLATCTMNPSIQAQSRGHPGTARGNVSHSKAMSHDRVKQNQFRKGKSRPASTRGNVAHFNALSYNHAKQSHSTKQSHKIPIDPLPKIGKNPGGHQIPIDPPKVGGNIDGGVPSNGGNVYPQGGGLGGTGSGYGGGPPNGVSDVSGSYGYNDCRWLPDGGIFCGDYTRQRYAGYTPYYDACVNYPGYSDYPAGSAMDNYWKWLCEGRRSYVNDGPPAVFDSSEVNQYSEWEAQGYRMATLRGLGIDPGQFYNPDELVWLCPGSSDPRSGAPQQSWLDSLLGWMGLGGLQPWNAYEEPYNGPGCLFLKPGEGNNPGQFLKKTPPSSGGGSRG